MTLFAVKFYGTMHVLKTSFFESWSSRKKRHGNHSIPKNEWYKILFYTLVLYQACDIQKNKGHLLSGSQPQPRTPPRNTQKRNQGRPHRAPPQPTFHRDGTQHNYINSATPSKRYISTDCATCRVHKHGQQHLLHDGRLPGRGGADHEDHQPHGQGLYPQADRQQQEAERL